MTAFDHIITDTSHFQIYWTAPIYPPLMYKMTTSCKFLCEDKTYYLTEIMIDSMQTSSTTDNLRPGSACLIKLLAVYNPASIDPGIGLSAHTQLASKRLYYFVIT